MAFTDVPRIPLFQPWLDVAMQKNVTGYRYWFSSPARLPAIGQGLTVRDR